MKNIYNISIKFSKILVMLLLVVFLSACKSGIVVGEACETEVNEPNIKNNCADVTSKSCLGCQIFDIMFKAVGVSVMRLHSELTSGAMALMMICFSLWLAKRLLTFVSSVTDSSIAQVWNEIAKQAFLCMFCGILASSPSMLIYAVNTFVYPVYAAFIKLGIELLNNALDFGESSTSQTIAVFGTKKTLTIVNKELGCKFDSVGLITTSGFPVEFGNTLKCMINILKEYLSLGGEISFKLMKNSSFFTGMIAGFFVYLTFWVVRIMFVFYLVDTIFQMGIIILVLPIFIMAYAFKSTRGWTGTIFKHMIASAGFLMCFSVIVSLVLTAMVSLVTKRADIFNPGGSLEGAEVVTRDLGISVFCLLLIGFLVQSTMAISQGIMSSLIGSSMTSNFQQNLKSMLEKAKKLVMSGLGSAATVGMSMLPAGAIRTFESIKASRAKIRRLTGGKIENGE